MTSMTIKSIAAGFAGLGLAMSASAATNWELSTPEEEGVVPHVTMTNADGPTVSLFCSDKLGVQAAVHLEGADFSNSVAAKSKMRTRTVDISTDSMSERGDAWGYVRNAKTIISTRPWQGKRLFNAAIKGESVTLDVARVGAYTLTMPTTDKAFSTFAKSCSATAPN